MKKIFNIPLFAATKMSGRLLQLVVTFLIQREISSELAIVLFTEQMSLVEYVFSV